jgi:hypothetical protein
LLTNGKEIQAMLVQGAGILSDQAKVDHLQGLLEYIFSQGFPN